MKRWLLLTVLGCWYSATLHAQNPGWLVRATQELELVDQTVSRINVADINGDEFPDLVIVDGVYGRNQIKVFINEKDPDQLEGRERRFVDYTDASGVNLNPDPSQSGRRADIVCLADIDNDGDNDMVTGIFHFNPSNVNEALIGDRCEVLLNDGKGRFTLVPNSGLPQLGFISITGFSFLDYDLDGRLDLYIATHSQHHQNNDFRQDYLLRGNGDGSFVDVSAEAGIDQVAFPMYGCSVTDWNNDGYPDIFTSPYCRSPGSAWRNNGDGTFTDVAAQIGYSAHYSRGDKDGLDPNGRVMCQWGAYPCDYDNDGDMDILQVLVHGGIDPGEGRTVLNINQGPNEGFRLRRDLTKLIRSDPQSSHLGNFDASWFDMDNDGKMDVIITESVYAPELDRIFLHHQDDHQTLVDVTPELGLLDVKSPGSIEVFDFDLDGDDDIISQLTRENSKAIVLENRIGSSNNWIGIKAMPPAGVNQSGIGTKIRVYTDRAILTREIQAGVGHFAGQQPFILNFGLGDATEVKAVEFIWPSRKGITTIIRNPPMNRIISNGQAQSTALTIYPNPAESHIYISGENMFDDGLESFAIVDMAGRRVAYKASEINPSNVKIDIKNLSPGAYIVSVLKGDGRVSTQKFIKR